MARVILMKDELNILVSGVGEGTSGTSMADLYILLSFRVADIFPENLPTSLAMLSYAFSYLTMNVTQRNYSTISEIRTRAFGALTGV